MTLPLSVGKIRHLQQCATPRGTLSVLALDHRNNLRNLLRPQSPGEVSGSDLSAFKRTLVRNLAPAASAVLLDPEFSAAQCITGGDLPGSTGLVIALEASGYAGDSTARQSRILPGWSVEKAKRMGASAIKLLVYYHPESPMANEMEKLVQSVAQDCAKHDLLFFLETLSYSLDPAMKKLPPDEMHYVVIETARRLTPLGGDILKTEFPLDVTVETDEKDWLEACVELSHASQIPWVLLSGSASYETYLRQVSAACTAGATGIAVGRAVWRETTSLPEDQRGTFLRDVARTRMHRLSALVDALAHPWGEFYSSPDPQSNWFASY